MFKVLAKTWLNKRNETDTRYDKSSKLHILIYTNKYVYRFARYSSKESDTSSNPVQFSYPDVPGNPQDPQA